MPTTDLIFHTLTLLALGMVLFTVGHWLLSVLLRPVALGVELFQKDNVAMGVATAGYDLGLVVAFGATLLGEPQGWLTDIASVLQYGSMAIALYFACAWLARLVLLGRIGLVPELRDDRNLGVAFVLAGYLIASGLLIHGAMSGRGGGWLSLVVFFALAQAVLLVVGPIYRLVSGLNLRTELKDKNNAAAGLAYGGCLLGMGTILGQLLSGEFVSWGASFASFASYAGGALVALPLVRWVADIVLAPGVKLSREIAPEEQAPNLAAGVIEATSYVAAGTLIAWSMS